MYVLGINEQWLLYGEAWYEPKYLSLNLFEVL